MLNRAGYRKRTWQTMPGIAGLSRAKARPLQYADKALRLGPIAYWPLWEPAGATVAQDISGNGYDAAATNCDFAQTGIGDRRTSVFLDGVNDSINGFDVGLASAFNGSEFTLLSWALPFSWTDGADRDLLVLYQDGSNFVILRKTTVNNTLLGFYNAGGVAKTITVAGNTQTELFTFGLTVSKAADEVKMFIGGVKSGATRTGLGVWAAAALTQVRIGTGIALARKWHGHKAHDIIINRALSETEMASIGVL